MPVGAIQPSVLEVSKLDRPLVCTIGHSNRPIVTFIDLLRTHEIARVIDVRTVPRSRHNPHFNRETLGESLAPFAIGYMHLPGLGGLRQPRADSVNTGWKNRSFRGYADYMQSPEFAENVERVADMATVDHCALMCAEAVPWRCHRSLIGDALLVRGVLVEDIMGPGKRKPHVLTAFAHVDAMRITYPPAADALRQATFEYAEEGGTRDGTALNQDVVLHRAKG